MKKSEYHKIIDRELKPKLIALGFQEVKLKDCMCPEVLYRKNNLWFGTSWDCRDRYLTVDLGHLYWCKDVMARVIVVGDYASYSDEIEKIKETNKSYLVKIASLVANTLQEAVSIYNERYDQIISVQKMPPGRAVSNAELSDASILQQTISACNEQAQQNF